MITVSCVHRTEKRARYRIKGLTVDAWEPLSEAINALEGVISTRFNAKASSLIVSFRDSEVCEAIESLCRTWEVTEVAQSACDPYEGTCHTCVGDEKPDMKHLFKAGAALVAEPLIPNDTAKMVLTSFATRNLLIEGTKELFKEGLTSKVLEATAVGVSLARKDYLAANSTNVMLELGEYIEETTVHRSDDLIKELAKPNVSEVWIEVLEDEKRVLKRIPAEELAVGDLFVVGAGETIAADGHIIDGSASVNQVSMTGEAEPVKKERGDRVISGTVLEEGRLKVWAEHVGEDTATSRINHYIKTSLEEKSAIGLKATRLADKLVPVTLGLAVLSYAVSRDFENVASVLQADYSCALKLATPVAFKTAISQAGRDGIMVKGAKSIEALASADTFVFDKTGTLTYGELEVRSIHSFDSAWSEEDILNLTASAEEHYFHPVAEAVVKAAKNRGFVHMHHEEVEFIVAHGVKTIANHKSVVIGSRHFLEDDEKIDFSAHTEQIETLLKGGETMLYIGYDGKLLGTIGMVDKVRENAKATLKALKNLGAKEIVMLTGDIESKAHTLADELGVDRVFANMLPTDKANVIKALKAEGRHVVFVGDGINDAPSLMSADVGISMQKGADIAKATADIGLLKDDIAAIAEIKDAANKTMRLIQNNFNATVGINSAILLSATSGLLSPIATAVLHNGTTIGLLLNSMKGVKIDKV